jgi:hypothetical protein
MPHPIPLPGAVRSHIAKNFSPLLLDPFDVAVMDAMPVPVCGLTPELTIGYVNRAWTAFARANGGAGQEDRWGLGANVLAVTPAVLRPFYEQMFARAVETHAPVEHDYECSSPTHQRRFRMRVFPTPAGGFVVVHSLLREAAHSIEAHAAVEKLYRDRHGLIVQCAHCRRVRRAITPAATTALWDWVPDYVAHMPARTSHGLCVACRDYFYSD